MLWVDVVSDKTYAADDATDAVTVIFSPASASTAADESETSCQWAFKVDITTRLV